MLKTKLNVFKIVMRTGLFVKMTIFAQLGDQVVIDFVGTKDGVAFEGGSGENYPLELGSGSFIPGFEEQLVGVKKGEEKRR